MPFSILLIIWSWSGFAPKPSLYDSVVTSNATTAA
jgi:hypothetical protein